MWKIGLLAVLVALATPAWAYNEKPQPYTGPVILNENIQRLMFARLPELRQPSAL